VATRRRRVFPLATIRGRLAARGVEQMLIELAQRLKLPGAREQINSVSPERVPGSRRHSKDSVDKAMEMRERGVVEFDRIRHEMIRRLESEEFTREMDSDVKAKLLKGLKEYLK
jgi:hypothetical protein